MFRSIRKNILKSTLVLAGVLAVYSLVSIPTHALTYQQDIGVSFTFNPSISVTLSSADLIIPNLAPGTASDSNIITVNVKTNNANGYTLNATVGNNTAFNTRDLKHQSSTITDKFSSVAFGSSIATNTALSDNTWGYSFLDTTLNNGTNTTWSAYSGLPLYNDETNIATLKAVTGPVATSAGDDIQFKIAARAADSITSGEYNNVINFMAVAVAAPMPKTLAIAFEDAGKTKLNGYYKMQDMSSTICNAVEVLDEDSQMQAIDTRDNKVYWITKLQDGHCWMTQNLDHDIDTSFAYTPQNTDITTNWTPIRATIDASSVTNNSIPNWANNNNTPYSVDPGDVYWNSTPFYASVVNLFLNNDWGADPVKFQKNTPFAANGTHGHVGNYYNWSAALAMNDTSTITDNTYSNPANNPQTSICPAGWRLPTISNQGNVKNSTNEFIRLNGLYNNASTSSSQNLEAAPLYLVRAGGAGNSRQYDSGRYGCYWSSTVSSSSNAYNLSFNSSYIYQIDYDRYNGFSLRCLSR